jgi:hypothetical protein
MKTLEQQVCDYYATQALPEERVQSIVQLSRTVSPSRRLTWAVGAMAAAILLAGVLFVMNRPVQSNLTQRVMVEIAKNHSKKLQPEFVTGNYQELQAQLSRVEFSILPPGGFLRSGFSLEGGRYCSVQSELAAQLKLQESASGEACTLYVAEATPPLAQIKPGTQVVDGVRVQVWIEDGRLFGLARDAIPAPAGKKP